MTDFGRIREMGERNPDEKLGVIKANPRYGAIYTQDYYHFSPFQKKITRDSLHPNHPYEGGPFDSTSVSVTYTDHHASSGSEKVGSSIYTGAFRVGEYGTGLNAVPSLPNSQYETCKSYGPTAWNRFKPAKPVVSGSVFFAELRDLPGLLFKRLNSFRNIGNNYLAVQFGWKPFLSDLRAFVKSARSIDKQISQLRRNNGKVVKRSGPLFTNTDKSSISTRSVSSGSVLPNYTYGTHTLSTWTEYETSCWFSGRFRYFIPGLDSQKWGKMRAYQELWDLKITPEQVYQLLPFSWLLDWVSNAGDVISNLQSAVDDQLVAKYAYVMYKKRTTENFKISFKTRLIKRVNGKDIWIYHPGTSLAQSITESKSRAAATPFGFNFSWDGFTSYQLSILAALGMSRSKF